MPISIGRANDNFSSTDGRELLTVCRVQIQRWVQLLVGYEVVAIGGNMARSARVIKFNAGRFLPLYLGDNSCCEPARSDCGAHICLSLFWSGYLDPRQLRLVINKCCREATIGLVSGIGHSVG